MAKMYVGKELVKDASIRECLSEIHKMCEEKGCKLQRQYISNRKKLHLNEQIINRSLKGLNLATYKYRAKIHELTVVCADSRYNVYFIVTLKG